MEREDYTTPVNKKECLHMLDKMAETASTKEAREAAKTEYMRVKRYGSDDGRK